MPDPLLKESLNKPIHLVVISVSLPTGGSLSLSLSLSLSHTHTHTQALRALQYELEFDSILMILIKDPSQMSSILKDQEQKVHFNISILFSLQFQVPTGCGWQLPTMIFSFGPATSARIISFIVPPALVSLPHFR